jgi:hypothetical protein
MRWPLGIFVVSLLATACGLGSNSGSAPDATIDTRINVSLDVPPGCPPDKGNETGIGAPCTATGNECPSGLSCSCQNWFGYTMPATMPCFCTTVSFTTISSCGSGATACPLTIPLSSGPLDVYACFPDVCLSGGQCPVL